MVVVAIAGATTGFGLTLLHTFLELNAAAAHPHTLILLSRSAQPELAGRAGLEVRVVDYGSHAGLVAALGGVDTVLSTVGGSGEAIGAAQLALLAAAQAAGVRRFAPSEYAASSYAGVDLYAAKARVWEATRASGLEYTRFACGLFMSLLAAGTPKPPTAVGVREGRATGEDEALAGLRPWNFVLNLAAGTADLPPDAGAAAMAWTDMRDIARFVYSALDLDAWPEELGMRGDVKSFRDLIPIVERIQKRRWLSKTNTVAELEAAMAQNPGLAFYNQARIAISTGWAMVGDELNQKFPHVKPVTCEEFLEKWWGGVELGEAEWTENKAFGAHNMNRASEKE